LDARRKLMEEGIALYREAFEPKKWLKGTVSAVQPNGLYVSVIAGKDAFIPVAEMQAKFTVASEEGEGKMKPSPSFEPGKAVDFRVIRHSWQTDSFIASMMSYEESVAKKDASRGYDRAERAPRADRGDRGDSQRGPISAPPAAMSGGTAEQWEQSEAADGSNERLPVQSPELSKAAKKLAAKGYSFVDSSTATELNSWLAASSKDKATGSKVVVKNEKSFVVTIARGMDTKTIGQLTFAGKPDEKEMKEAAIELCKKEGELKAGKDHKGVTFMKNIITVKL